ncbi:MAG: hypothetical protein VX589_21065, partial [Myxococcota bacterium]|nr:hypothetical protein [Myxococcota bacterium]
PLDLRTVVPRPLTDGLPTRDVSGFLVDRSPGSAYVTEAFSDLWGVSVLANSESLPDSSDDERVVDQDEDGQPGVTLKVTNDSGDEICEVYVVQRTIFQLEGTVVSRRRVSGEVRSTSSKTVLASSAALCASGDIAPSFAPSRFFLVRIDGREEGIDLDEDMSGRVDCDEVRSGLREALGTYGIEKSTPMSENCLPPSERSEND